MSVYVLVEDDYESNYVRGVFSTLEAAAAEAVRVTRHHFASGGEGTLRKVESHRGPTRLEDAQYMEDYEPELEAWGYVVRGAGGHVGTFCSIYRFEVDSVP